MDCLLFAVYCLMESIDAQLLFSYALFYLLWKHGCLLHIQCASIYIWRSIITGAITAEVTSSVEAFSAEAEKPVFMVNGDMVIFL